MKNQKLIQFVCIFLLAVMALSACMGSDALLGDVGLSLEPVTSDQPLQKSNQFEPGDSINFNLEFTSGYKGLEAVISWKRGGEVLQTETIALERDANSLDPLWISSKLETEEDWSVGEYHCEYFVPDQGTQMLIFTLQ